MLKATHLNEFLLDAINFNDDDDAWQTIYT